MEIWWKGPPCPSRVGDDYDDRDDEACIELMKRWWTDDEVMMKIWWKYYENMMKIWWKHDENMMKLWWKYDEKMVKRPPCPSRLGRPEQWSSWSGWRRDYLSLSHHHNHHFYTEDNIIAITTVHHLVPGNDSPSCVDAKSIIDHTIGNTPPLFRIKV